VLKILNLGAGVQSSCVLLMSAMGVLPRVDYAIFADTQWEPREVYEHLDWLETQANGIPIRRVTAGNLREAALNGTPKKTKEGKHYISLPIYTLGPNGERGMVDQRQCTKDYKIIPIEREIRSLLGLKRGQRWPMVPSVEQWFGISTDEIRRVRTPRRIACEHRYPLIYNLGMSRKDCLAWLAQQFPGRKFPRSACIGCPFHDDNEWAAIKAKPDQWADAIDADAKVRRCNRDRKKADGYLHRSCKPLAEVELKIKREVQEDPRLFVHECMGMCGV